MQEYIISDAKQKVWCDPHRDNQNVLWPERVTQGAGALISAFVLGRQLPLPTRNRRYQVYQFGQLTPALLGLIENWPSWATEKWFTFEQAMNELPLYVNIYNTKGVNIPRKNSYFMLTREKCLVFAVFCDLRLPVKWGTDDIFFRLYNSSYLRSVNSAIPPYYEVQTFEVPNVAALTQIVNVWNVLKARPGQARTFVNGWWVSEPNGKTVKPGDIVELVYDCTVKRIVNWTVKNLKMFTSELDNKLKYILHYNKSTKVDQIEFYDDIDIYIHFKTPEGNDVGYYYHKNQQDAMRMLTHRDYSLTADYVTYIINAIADDLGIVGADYQEFEVQMSVRRTDLDRPLINDPNKIFEMYRLSDQRILMAMSGVDSLVPPWWASNLEKSGYSLFMGMLRPDIDIKAVEAAYGYYYSAQVLGMSPLPVTTETSARLVQLPIEASKSCTVYEYNNDGTLLGTYLHTSGDIIYRPVNETTARVEAIMGKGSDRLGVVYGRTDLPIKPLNSFRVYHCRYDYSVTPAVPDLKWTDITGDETLYKVEDGKVVWIAPDTDQYLCVRTDLDFLSYKFTATPRRGNVLFMLSETSDMGDGFVNGPLQIPGGDLQIWLEGRNLVYGIDYVVKFPYVCINNYNAFAQPVKDTPQRVEIRVTGFCKDMQFIPPKRTGFVSLGTIGRDGGYDIHKDKVMHLSIGGSVVGPEDVSFFEDLPPWQIHSPINGMPYQIVDMIVPLQNFVESGTYEMLKPAQHIDEMVASYMTTYFPWPTSVPISEADARYRLTSPFIGNMVDMCLTNEISFEDWVTPTDDQVRQICKPYEPLLVFDPLSQENHISDNYVNITPTRYARPPTVTRAQYRFLERVVELYGNGLVGLNNFVKFTV